MDRRRALLAASQMGGEFYCDLYIDHPLKGEIYGRTSTFIIDGEKTWGEIEGLVDIEHRSQIFIATLPNGKEILGINNIATADEDGSFMPETAISPSDKIIIGYTYKFTA